MEEQLIRERYIQSTKKLREMRKNKIFTDVLLQCRGGFIHAHRCVLMATNSFFYKTFTTHIVGDTVIQIEFENVDADVMDIIIGSIYGDVPPPPLKKDVAKLFKLLDTCRMIDETILFNYLTTVVVDSLCVENCVEIWTVMSKYQSKTTERKIMQFVLENLAEMLKFGQFGNVSSNLVANLIKHAAASSRIGDDLLPVVIEWGKKNPAKRLDKLVRLFGALDKLKFTKACTTNYIKFDWFVKSYPQLITCLKSLKCTDAKSNSALCHQRKMAAPSPSTTHASTRTESDTEMAAKKHVARVQVLDVDKNESDTEMAARKHVLDVDKNKYNNDKSRLLFHFYFKADSESLKMSTHTYSAHEHRWCDVTSITLPGAISNNWYPMTSNFGDEFYFAISKDKFFVAYNKKTTHTYYGPAVKAQNRVTGIVSGKYMYVSNCESIVQFDSDKIEWKLLAPAGNVLGTSNLLGVGGDLFFHSAFPSAMLKYDFRKDEWLVKKSFKESSAIKSIRCKCVQVGCKRKLYFVANDKQLLSYDAATNVWAGKTIPEPRCSLPLFMNCDESFILFGDKHDKFNYFVYYPVENKWETFRNKTMSWQDRRYVACDVTLLRN